MFDFAPLGLSTVARVLAGGLSGSAPVATAASARGRRLAFRRGRSGAAEGAL